MLCMTTDHYHARHCNDFLRVSFDTFCVAVYDICDDADCTGRIAEHSSPLVVSLFGHAVVLHARQSCVQCLEYDQRSLQGVALEDAAVVTVLLSSGASHRYYILVLVELLCNT